MRARVLEVSPLSVLVESDDTEIRADQRMVLAYARATVRAAVVQSIHRRQGGYVVSLDPDRSVRVARGAWLELEVLT